MWLVGACSVTVRMFIAMNIAYPYIGPFRRISRQCTREYPCACVRACSVDHVAKFVANVITSGSIVQTQGMLKGREVKGGHSPGTKHMNR